MRQYEVTFIVDPVLPKDQIQGKADKYVDYLKSNGCEIVNIDEMGLRQLAYPIKRRNSGVYYCVEFKNETGQVINGLELGMRRDEELLRFLTVHLDKFGVKYNEDRRNGLIGKAKGVVKKEEKKDDRNDRRRGGRNDRNNDRRNAPAKAAAAPAAKADTPAPLKAAASAPAPAAKVEKAAAAKTEAPAAPKAAAPAPKAEKPAAPAPAAKAKVETPATPVAAAAPATPAKPDDLKKIEGIGPKIASLLNDAGIMTFANLAATDASKVKEILAAAGSRFTMHNPTTWAQQAQMAADGKWAELKKWQDESDGGKPIDSSSEEE